MFITGDWQSKGAGDLAALVGPLALSQSRQSLKGRALDNEISGGGHRVVPTSTTQTSKLPQITLPTWVCSGDMCSVAAIAHSERQRRQHGGEQRLCEGAGGRQPGVVAERRRPRLQDATVQRRRLVT